MGSSLKISTILTVFCNSTFYFIQLVCNYVDNKFRKNKTILEKTECLPIHDKQNCACNKPVQYTFLI